MVPAIQHPRARGVPLDLVRMDEWMLPSGEHLGSCPTSSRQSEGCAMDAWSSSPLEYRTKRQPGLARGPIDPTLNLPPASGTAGKKQHLIMGTIRVPLDT